MSVLIFPDRLDIDICCRPFVGSVVFKGTYIVSIVLPFRHRYSFTLKIDEVEFI